MNPAGNSKGLGEKQKIRTGGEGGGGLTIMEIRGHGGVMHFGISEGKGGVKIWKPSIGRFGYFLESPNTKNPANLS